MSSRVPPIGCPELSWDLKSPSPRLLPGLYNHAFDARGAGELGSGVPRP